MNFTARCGHFCAAAGMAPATSEATKPPATAINQRRVLSIWFSSDAIGGIAGMPRTPAARQSDANDPQRSIGSPFCCD